MGGQAEKDDAFKHFADVEMVIRSVDSFKYPQTFYYNHELLRKITDVEIKTNDDQRIPAHRFILLHNNIYFRNLIIEKLYTEPILEVRFPAETVLKAIRLIYGEKITIVMNQLLAVTDICAFWGISFAAIQKPINEDDTGYDVFGVMGSEVAASETSESDVDRSASM